MVLITMENGKQMKFKLRPDVAPISCENFEKLVKQGFYDGLCFHRVISGFMIQAAIANLGIFELATTNAETIFQNILLFIGRWTRRVGAAGTLVGAVMFGFSIKDNNAVGKVAALKTFAAGAIVVSVSGILHTFV